MDMPTTFDREYREITLDGEIVRPDGRTDEHMRVTWMWRRAVHYVCQLTFHNGEDVEWEIARELLRTGLDARAGYQDVVVSPAASGARSAVALALATPTGSLTIRFDATAVRAFIDDTMTLEASDDPHIADTVLVMRVAEWAADMNRGGRS